MMDVRPLRVRVGARVRTRSTELHKLPVGLPVATEVVVISYDRDTNEYVVGDSEHRAWQIKSQQNLDPGYEYLCEGYWRPWHDLRVVAEQQRHSAQHPE